ncbi:MAG: serine/threonine-protein kinase [Polyangiaceae bacterium]
MICPSCATPNPDHASWCSSCGAQLVVAAPAPTASQVNASANRGGRSLLLPGDVVDGKYRIERVIGEGGMGVVYLAQDTVTEAPLVIKAILPELAHEPEYRERVRQEARALARIDHPNVVRLNAVISTPETMLLAMQYVDGGSLDRVIAEHRARGAMMPAEQVFRLFRQIVAGVAAAHAEGVVHRDIKPANVLLRTRDGSAKVTDFGLAKPEEDARAGRGQTRGIIGSLWYMAPEQVVGQRDLDKRVDVYALGIMLFEMLVGHVPFDARSDYEIMKMHTEAPMPSVYAIRRDVPPAIDTFLSRLCAKRREDRPSSCEEILRALDSVLSTPVVARPGSNVPSTVPEMPAVPEPPNFGQQRVIPAGTTIPQEPANLARDKALLATTPAIRSAITGELIPADEAELPSTVREGPSKTKLVVGLLGAMLLGSSAVLSVWYFVLREPEVTPQPSPVASASTKSASSANVTASASSSAHSEHEPFAVLTSLQGKWVSETGRHYDAVLSGTALEFRVRDPKEFDRQGYLEGEPRFSLRVLPKTSATEFLVEDRVRPQPPNDLTYAAASRGTCAEIWSSVGNTQLRAQWDGKQLSVDMVKVTPDRAVFVTKGTSITGCSRLSSSKVDKLESMLKRE